MEIYLVDALSTCAWTFKTKILSPNLEVETQTEVISLFELNFAYEVKTYCILQINMHGSSTKVLLLITTKKEKTILH